MLYHVHFVSFARMDCQHFNLDVPDFEVAEELKQNLEHHEGLWGLFEEFNNGLQDLAKEDWISFR